MLFLMFAIFGIYVSWNINFKALHEFLKALVVGGAQMANGQVGHGSGRMEPFPDDRRQSTVFYICFKLV